MRVLLATLLLAIPALAAAQTPRPVDPKVVEQVRIISAKMEDWRGAWGVAGGQLGCKTAQSTGDVDIDMIACAALVACVKPILPDLKKIADGAGTKEEKKQRMGVKLSQQNLCLREHRGNGIAALALARGSE